VALLGASSSPSAEAPWPQSLPAGIGAQVRTCAARGGLPELVVPAHLKAAVPRAHRDAPVRTRTDTDLAQPEGVAVSPARAAKPREKAKVDGGGQGVARWRLARLRHHPCCALAEVHAALAPLLAPLPARPLQPWPGSRPARFEPLDRPALQPLPAQPSADAAGQLARGKSDAPGEVAGHDASGPSAVVRPQRDGRLRAAGVARCATGHRGARHPRSSPPGRHRPVAAHRPKAPQPSAAWPPPRGSHWAATRGPATAQVGATLLASRPHPQPGCRAW